MPNRESLTMPVIPVLLAAGKGSRMGGPKGLLAWSGMTLLQRLRDAYAQSPTGPCLVVASPDSGVEFLAQQLGMRSVLNPAPERGPLSSLWCALKVLDSESLGGILVHPVDCPVFDPEIPKQLILTWKRTERKMVVPTCQGKRGHPLLVAATLFPEILELDLEVGLRQLLWQKPQEILEVAVRSPEIRNNLNTPEDLERLFQCSPEFYQPHDSPPHSETSS